MGHKDRHDGSQVGRQDIQLSGRYQVQTRALTFKGLGRRFQELGDMCWFEDRIEEREEVVVVGRRRRERQFLLTCSSDWAERSNNTMEMIYR